MSGNWRAVESRKVFLCIVLRGRCTAVWALIGVIH